MDPEHEIARNPQICVSEDIAEDFYHYMKLILDKYESELDAIYRDLLVNLDGRLNKVSNWSNVSFKTANEWEEIRRVSKEICLKHKMLA